MSYGAHWFKLKTHDEHNFPDGPDWLSLKLPGKANIILGIRSATDIAADIVTPGVGKKPRTIHGNAFREEIVHPYLFPTGKFDLEAATIILIIPSKYLNQRLSNYIETFASDGNYIFFVPLILLKLQ